MEGSRRAGAEGAVSGFVPAKEPGLTMQYLVAREKREAEAHRKARKIVERYLRRAETEIDAAGRLQDDIANAIVRAMERSGA